MLFIISKILFIWYSIWILSVFIVLAVFWQEIWVDVNTLSLAVLPIFLPIFEKFFQFIKKDSIFNFEVNKENMFKLWCSVFLPIFIFFIREIGLVEVMILISFFAGIFFAIDERHYFSLSFILLLFVVLEILIWNNFWADSLSIYLYCFLCIWVFISIFNQTVNKELIEKQEKNIFFEKIKNPQKAEKIVYFWFLFYLIAFVVLLILKEISLIKYLLILFFTSYWIGKMFWFEMNYKFDKKNLENELKWVKIWNWYLISSILSLILVKFFINWDNILIITLFIIILIINTISFILF